MYLGRTLSALLNLNEKTQTELATAVGVRRPTVNALINEGTRPHPATLGAICDWWPDPSQKAECLIAHLRDEIQRAGQAQGVVEIRDSHRAPADALQILIDAFDSDIHVRCLLEELAQLITPN